MFRSIFFISWLLPWFVLIYFFEFSRREVFLLAALQGIIGEFFIAELFLPGFGMAAALGYDPINITIGALITILLYGCNLAIPYTPFAGLFQERLNRRTTGIKYPLSFIPLVAFCIAFLSLIFAIQAGFPYLF